MKKNNKGFSLVELIVVVLILGILAVAVSPQIMNWINKSKEGKDEAYAGSVASATESVALEYLARTGGLTDAQYKLDDTGVTSVATPDPNPKKEDTTVTPAITVMEALADEIELVVANCAKPEQKDKSYYEINVTYNATAGTVSVKVYAK